MNKTKKINHIGVPFNLITLIHDYTFTSWRYICLDCHAFCSSVRVFFGRIIYPVATTEYLILAESPHRRLASRHRPINVIIFTYSATRVFVTIATCTSISRFADYLTELDASERTIYLRAFWPHWHASRFLIASRETFIPALFEVRDEVLSRLSSYQEDLRSRASGIYISNYTLSALNDDRLTISPSRICSSRGGSCSGEVTMRYVRTGEINAHLEIGRLWQCWKPGYVCRHIRGRISVSNHDCRYRRYPGPCYSRGSSNWVIGYLRTSTLTIGPCDALSRRVSSKIMWISTVCY